MSNNIIKKLEKFVLIFLGGFIVINTILLQCFGIGNYKKEIVLTYIIAFIISIIQFQDCQHLIRTEILAMP